MGAFDDADVRQQAAPIKPLFTVALENEPEVRKWLNNAYKVVQEREQDRHQQISHNFRLYKGSQAQFKDGKPRTQEGDSQGSRKNRDKLVVNHLYDITETQIARITRYKPAVSISPGVDEYEDKVASKITKKFIDDLWYRIKVDPFITRLHRRSRIAGEDYLLVDWDKDAGPIHPQFKEAAASGEQIPLLDDNGEQMKDESGQPRFIKKPVHIGEVTYKLLSTREVLCEPKTSWADVNWVIILEPRDVDELKVDYPEQASRIKCESTPDGMDDTYKEDLKMKNQVLTMRLIHRHSHHLAEGREIIATTDVILENNPLKFEHGRLPLVRLTDIDDEEDLHAISFFANIEGLQHAYNNSTTMILQNQALCAYPKWMMPKGAAEISSLGSDRTIVQYKGAVAPSLAQANPTPAEVFNFREGILGEMRQLGGGSEQDRGAPPPGIKAGVALQFLDEQVTQRYNVYVQKHNDVVIDLVQLSLSVMGQFYDDQDGRLEKILGKAGLDSIGKFSVKQLAAPYNVRIQNSSALPDSKAAKTQTIIDLKDSFPDIFTSEQVIEILELGQLEKFQNMASAAIRSAEAENEDMKQGVMIKEPAEFEHHVLHWKSHVQSMQDRAFKEMPEQVQQLHKDHLLATELLMYEQSVKSPAFAMELMKLPMFPIMFVPDPAQNAAVNPMAAQQAAAAAPPPSGLPEDLAAYEGPPQEMPVDAPAMEAAPPLQEAV